MTGSARALAPDNPFKDFVPNGGAVTSNKLIAATANCTTCHVRFAEHGGPRRSTEFCAVCHNPATIDPDSGESVDLAYMAHSIHRGEARNSAYVVYGFNGTKFDTGEVTYPQPIAFCETCHVQSASMPQGDDWKTNPGAAACGGCHDQGLNKTGPSATTGLYTYTYTHSSTILPPAYTAADGTCSGCHRADGAAGDILDAHKKDPDRKAIENGSLFTYKVLSVENAVAGQAPKVTFQILGTDGKPMDVKAITTGRLRLDFAWSTADIHNVADVAGDPYAANRGEAIVIDLIANKASIVDNGNGTFSYTLAQVLPAGFDDATLGKGLMVVLEGRRVMPDGSEAYPDSAFAFGGGAGSRKARRPGQVRNLPQAAGAARRQPRRRPDHLHGLPQLERRRHVRHRQLRSARAGCVHPRPACQQRGAVRCGHLSAEPRPLRGLPRGRQVQRGPHERAADHGGCGHDARERRGNARLEGRPRRFGDGGHLQGLPHLGRCRDPHAVAGWQPRRCQGAGAFVVRGRLRGLPRQGPDLRHGEAALRARCLTASAHSDRKNRNDTTFHDTFHDAPARRPRSVRHRAGRLQRRQRARGQRPLRRIQCFRPVRAVALPFRSRRRQTIVASITRVTMQDDGKARRRALPAR